MSLDACYCPEGLVEGVVLEVLWDIERCTEEGRRSGERITESVWWRAEVLELSHEGGKLIAIVKYEPMHGFHSQTAKLYVFPSHVQPVGEKEVTQLRWRFFESSGDVSYYFGEKDREKWLAGSASPLKEDDRVAFIQRRVDHLSDRIQEVERISTPKKEGLSQFSGSPEMVDTRIEGSLAMLRQKLAFSAQKAFPYSRVRGDAQASLLIDRTSNGSLRAGIDFSAEEFERLCQLIHSKDCKVQFRVDKRSIFPSSGHLKACTTVAEVLFGSLTDLCEALGITQRADQMTIAMRKKYPAHNDAGSPDDVAIRICGTFIADRWDDQPMSIIVVCRALHEHVPMDCEICVLRRENTKLNPRTKWYSDPLSLDFITASGLVQVLSKVSAEKKGPTTLENSDYVHSIRMLAFQTGCFALRWKPLPSLNPKLWTRRIGYPSLLHGTLEVELPYILFRGRKAVGEVEKLLTSELLSQAMK